MDTQNKPTYTLKDIGCYVDEARGIYAIDAIVRFAEAHGAEIEDCEDHTHEPTYDKSRFAGCEFSGEIEDQCDDYMNETFPVDGATWGRSENGDWGLWPIEDETEHDSEVLTLESALLGGPGLDSYIFEADSYCVFCGRDITREVFAQYPNGIPYPLAQDSDTVPQPSFFTESDSALNCGRCGTPLDVVVIGEEDSEPSPEDYTIGDCGPLGSLYSVGQVEGKHLGEFKTLDEALAAIKSNMEEHKFWPNVWRISDHGNAHLITL